MNDTCRRYDRAHLESLNADGRRVVLVGLEAALNVRLASVANLEDFWREAYAIIEKLKEAGHDLYHHHYDGDGYALWGGDYMRRDKAPSLGICFDYYKDLRVELSWPGDEDWHED